MLLDFDSICEELENSGSAAYDLLTPKQQSVENDVAWVRAICGARQWGKSTWIGPSHSFASIPGVTSLAIASTVTKARDLLLPSIEWLNRETEAGIVHKASAFQFVLPDGGVIQCMGVGSVREADKVRGFTPPYVTVEEAGTFKPELLQYLVESCIAPAQIKWYGAGGRGVALVGTPGLLVEDYWHRLCKGEFGASVHHGTVFDNPWIPDPQGFLDLQLTNNKWTRATPRFRREYLGEFCAETDSMCYAGWDKVILPDYAAPTAGRTIMGMDLGGAHKPSSFVVIRITQELDVEAKRHKWILHFVHAEKMMAITIHDVAKKTQELRKRFGVSHIRGDAGGLGTIITSTLREQFTGCPVEDAPKAGFKQGRIWALDSIWRQGTGRIYEGARALADELVAVPWNDEKDDHHPAYSDHLCDASHYGAELVQQWERDEAPKDAQPGTAEFAKKEMEKYKRAAIARANREDN